MACSTSASCRKQGDFIATSSYLFCFIFISIINFGLLLGSNNGNQEIEVLLTYLSGYILLFHRFIVNKIPLKCHLSLQVHYQLNVSQFLIPKFVFKHLRLFIWSYYRSDKHPKLLFPDWNSFLTFWGVNLTHSKRFILVYMDNFEL